MSCSCKNGGNMFFYTRKEVVKVPKPVVDDNFSSFAPEVVEEVREYQDSFNLNCVTRTYATENEVFVILNDFHTEIRQVPIMNSKNKFSGHYKNQQDTVYSEIKLSKEDGERFKQLTEIQ